MSRLLKRWYVWLGLVLLLGLAGSVAIICANPGGITQANFERIQNGMSLEDVEAILWKGESAAMFNGTPVHATWEHGPNRITVVFYNGSVDGKQLNLASPWQNLQWYAKKGAAKIGIKWN
jgi:hypothetical protein